MEKRGTEKRNENRKEKGKEKRKQKRREKKMKKGDKERQGTCIKKFALCKKMMQDLKN